MRRLLVSGVALALLTGACTSSTAPTTTEGSSIPIEGADPGFYLNLVWHQHQPRYPLLEDGTVSRPWVRVHATKDYHDMAALVEEFPGIEVTFNLTPVLLMQLEELVSGTKDVYWALSEVPADDLDEDQLQFIIDRFFDVNPKVIARFPRFQELARNRDRGFDTDDLRDLQVLFNLAWTDPDFLAVAPLASLVAKGRGFSESDKATLFAEHTRIISEVTPLHARLWDEGRIEVTTTPLAHPILPLLADTSLATVGDPAALLPENRFQEIPDADQQVIRGLDVAERLLGRRPDGMWPGEGAVAQAVMSLFSKNGVRWTATGEEVLAQSLGIGSFERDANDLVTRPELLYRPWQATLRRNDPVPMFFRDGLLSDLIGFEYSGTDGEVAAEDLMRRLRNIRDSLDVEAAHAAGAPYVVTIILDGENAWEHYDNDGKDFLRAFYRELAAADWISTITPSQYLARYGEPESLEDVWPGAWFQANFATWIGEEEEATAWDYLFWVREDLAAAKGRAGYEEAYEAMLFAQGSDWFWWYGSDQDSGDDGYFDTAYRESLGGVYDALGLERPSFLLVPIIPQLPVVAETTPEEVITISIDGSLDDWAVAGRYRVGTSLYGYAFDRENLYVLLQPEPGGTSPLTLYLGAKSGEKSGLSSAGEVLGFGGTAALVWDGVDRACYFAGVPDLGDQTAFFGCTPLESAVATNGVEIAIPFDLLGALETGDLVLAKVEEARGLVPKEGPMAFQVPDISNVEVFLEVDDPLGDDHGPGRYTYPTDAVFTPGSYDVRRFTAGIEGEDLVLTFEMVAPITNPWGSPRNLSIQTFDVYVDTDPGSGTGQRLLLPGRNAALGTGEGWERAVTVEGWEPALYLAHPDGSIEETRPSFGVVVFGDKGKVVIRLPRSLLGEGDPASWGYAAVVLSQEGFPSSGVRRVRDVETAAQQWRLGGAPSDANHTRIIDVAWMVAGEQEEMLSGYPSSASLDGLGPADFGRVPLLIP